MSILQNDGLVLDELVGVPAVLPSAGQRKVYMGDDGQLYAVGSDGTVVQLSGPAGSALGIGSGTPFLWRYAAGATPPTTAATLQAAEGVDTAVAVGHVCVTNTGDIFKCSNATNQAALVWRLIATHATLTNLPNTIMMRTADGEASASRFLGLSEDTQPIVVGVNLGDGPGMQSVTTTNEHHHIFGTVSAIDRLTGALVFVGASAATNRNAQLTSLFSSIPTSAGASGTLWNDAGTIKIVP